MSITRLVAIDIFYRLIMVVMILTYWFFALLALPWAWFDSMDSMGWTTMKGWKAGWEIYSIQSLREGFAEIFKPLGVRRL